MLVKIGYKILHEYRIKKLLILAFRLVPASEPCPPEAPEIADYSDTEVLLKWKQLKDDGNSPVLCYGLQYQENGKYSHFLRGSFKIQKKNCYIKQVIWYT